MRNPQNPQASMLANQEQQNAQVLQQMANKEAAAAQQLRSGNPTGASNLAAQEAQNQQMLQSMATKEGMAASKLGGPQSQ